MRPAARVAGLSPRRRVLVTAVALVVIALAAFGGIQLARSDQVVQPPASARLAGAVNVPLQSVCPGVSIAHGQLPTDPLVVGIVLRDLGRAAPAAPGPGQCHSLQALGGS